MGKEYLAWVRQNMEERFSGSAADDAKFDHYLGLQLVEVEEGKVILKSHTRDTHKNINGAIHGGILASIADIAMGFSCVTLKKQIVTLDMNIGYIKNVPVGNTITAIGKVLSNGRKIMRTSCEIYHENVLLTSVQATFYVTGEYTEESR